MVAQNSRSASSQKSQGIRLGKPKGTIQKSKLDEKQAIIQDLLKHKVSKSAIARVCGTSWPNLNKYIKRRGIQPVKASLEHSSTVMERA